MKNVLYFTVLSILLLTACKMTNTSSKAIPTVIKTEVPVRPSGQKDVLGLTCEKLDTVRVGFIGMGMRGIGAIERFVHIPGTKVVALCDVTKSRVEKAQDILKKNNRPQAVSYVGEDAWKALCNRDDIDLVYIVTDWKSHAPMSIYAMEHGKHVAVEVPGAMTLDEIWSVVDTAEKTQKHCMMLENCVYDFFEMTTLNMAQHGLFGEILHAEGAYIHNLERFWTAYWDNWRLKYNQAHRGDLYPTHGIGPVCQALNIHRGDRMKTLVSMDTKAVNGPAILEQITGEKVSDFQNGDHTMTIIRTENGKTIQIQHNVMTPRPYSRMYQLTGTKGFANKYPISGYVLNSDRAVKDGAVNYEDLNAHGWVSEEVKNKLMEQYKHPIVKDLEAQAKKVGGHGGMDFIMDYRLVYCLRNGLPLDMDVYDLAEWSCLIPLSNLSIKNGNAPVEVPDFTRGSWNKIQGFSHAMVKE